MGKDSTAGGGNGIGTGDIPLTRKDHHKTLGVSKAATAGGNGKGSGGIPLTGKAHYEIVAVNKAATAGGEDGKRPRGLGGAKGAAGAVAVPGGAKTAVKVTHEYCHEEETMGLREDGHEEEGEDVQDDHELVAHEDNGGAEMGDDDRSGGGGDGYYIDAGMRDADGFLNGDNYYYDVAAAGFDDGYGDDGGDGPDDWW